MEGVKYEKMNLEYIESQMIRSLLSLTPPRLKSCDSLLPSLPVPALEDTVERYGRSLSMEQHDSIL